jgi:6-pyruvoyltetrahydropterin/6-carboxytetrahydropterin synthase
VYELTVFGRFAAAHSLRNFKGRCEDLHGHNWRVEVTVRGNKLDPESHILMDFGDLKALMRGVLDTLDHKYLNEIAPFDSENPSSELIARYIYERIAPDLPDGVWMTQVAAWESDDSRAVYLGE